MSSILTAVPVTDNIMELEMTGQGRNYSYMFNFEQEFEHSQYRVWMEENWQLVCRWASTVYLLMIFGGQYLMQNRPPFQLRTPLIVWNFLLAIFSIFGAARTIPEFIFTFSTHGIYHSLCVPSFIERDRVSGFWTWMFVVSKVPELGDTVFIVLRKQKLIFLHWYHHVTVLIYCWYSFSEYTAPARWFVVMNFCVHSLMYSYYFLKAMRIKVPRSIAMVITTLQLLQMVVGCIVNYSAYTFKLKGMKCGVSETNLKLSLLMYSSYFVLFARFFYNTYMQHRLQAGKSEMITQQKYLLQNEKTEQVHDRKNDMKEESSYAKNENSISNNKVTEDQKLNQIVDDSLVDSATDKDDTINNLQSPRIDNNGQSKVKEEPTLGEAMDNANVENSGTEINDILKSGVENKIDENCKPTAGKDTGPKEISDNEMAEDSRFDEHMISEREENQMDSKSVKEEGIDDAAIVNSKNESEDVMKTGVEMNPSIKT